MMNQHEFENYAQVISFEMMEGLKNSAYTHGITLEMEVALRLLAHVGVETSEGGKLYNQIVQRTFTKAEAEAECKRKREAAVYRYELARLTVFLEHEDILPRTIKETFTLIDVKEESKKIREEIKRRRDAAAIADSDETMPPPKDKPNGGKPNGDNDPDDDDDDGDDGVLV